MFPVQSANLGMSGISVGVTAADVQAMRVANCDPGSLPVAEVAGPFPRSDSFKEFLCVAHLVLSNLACPRIRNCNDSTTTGREKGNETLDRRHAKLCSFARSIGAVKLKR
jgi:hypothetical protein